MRLSPSPRARRMTALVAPALALVVLSIPSSRPPVVLLDSRRDTIPVFSWSKDSLWFALEREYREFRALGCGGLTARVDAALGAGNRMIGAIGSQRQSPAAPVFDSLLDDTFQVAPMIAVCQQRLPDYVRLVTRTRSAVKRQSEHWDVTDLNTRIRMYTLLFGGRAALEEVMLQDSIDARPELVLEDDEPSRTPFTRILGVTIHSGDILVSRGGAQVSALIAVGNDFQGNFSHVALVYVDQKTSLASVIESRPKSGVAVHGLEDYLADVKLRVMVLRLRADLPALVADPMLPHKAADLALAAARRRRIPYNVRMDLDDSTRMYCSEVPSSAYGRFGVHLWMGMSTISLPGVASWLTAMGVRHFATEEPSDLEYDPQVRVVAEWRDRETLFMDHVDNVVTEAMLRGAQHGARLEYPWYMLPLGRLAKGYSSLRNWAGSSGPVPDDMNADAAMHVLSFDAKHTAIKRRVLAQADRFKREQGYVAPEWDLLQFAEQDSAAAVNMATYLATLREQL